ncbi:hypothetical protein GGR50DRAFT_152793 [Xylaria sp. CBS 124048]|nr:hypothetical protein GGR50DRAFT_152793 [Xylaria sp. CBS 124048]
MDAIKEAEELLLRVQQTYENEFGSIHPLTMDITNHLGKLYAHQRKYEEANAMFEQATEGRELLFGTASHPAVLDTYLSHAVLCSDSGQPEKAEAICQNVVFGMEDSHSWALTHLGDTYTASSQFEKAELVYKQVLEAREAQFGPDHQSTCDALCSLGGMYLKMCGLFRGPTASVNKMEETVKVYQEALRSYTGPAPRTFGRFSKAAKLSSPSSSTDTAKAMLELFQQYIVKSPSSPEHLEMLRKAEDVYRRAISGYMTTLGPDDSTTLNAILWHGVVCTHVHTTMNAELFFLVLNRSEKAFEADKLSAAWTLSVLGDLFMSQSKWDMAEDMFQRTLKALEPTNLFHDERTVRISQILIVLYCYRGKLSEAEEAYQPLLLNLNKSPKTYSPKNRAKIKYLGSLISHMKKLVKARKAAEGGEGSRGAQQDVPETSTD